MQGGWIVAAVLALTAPAEASTSSNDDLRSQIERLLTLAAEPSARNLVAIQRFYQALPAESRNDRRMKHAYALALIQQKQLHQASKLLPELGEERPQDAGLWRTKVWLALSLGERVRALTEIEQLASQAAHRSSQAEPLSDVKMAEFLGAVCGFFAGPWSDKVRAADAQQIEDRLRGAFDAKSQAAFDESKVKVVERYQELCEQHDQRAGQEQKAANQKLDKARKSLSDAAQALGDKQQALKAKEAKRTGDAKTKVADIEKERKSIDQKRQSLMQQIAPLETARLALLSQLLPEPPPVFGPALRRLTRLELLNIQHNNGIRFALAPIILKLTELETNVMLLNEREFELLAEGAATGMKYQEDLGKLAQQSEALKTDRNRLKYDAKRLKSKSAAGSPRLRGEAEQLIRFNTYVPFEFEREKERLLEELR